MGFLAVLLSPESFKSGDAARRGRQPLCVPPLPGDLQAPRPALPADTLPLGAGERDVSRSRRPKCI